jgi:anion-transporting  ArsA/GET3 family ATPase
LENRVKKAHFVTGKGGVGKSLVAAALARHLSLQTKSESKTVNQPILLAELNENSFYKDFLGLPKISYKPTKWKTNLDVCQWSPEDCLKEYALHLLKIESLYKLFMENPVSKSLIQVAPGLHELALLGKITSSPRHHGPAMHYEQLVIDSFATGHFLSLFRAPAAMAEAVQFGPMGEQTRSIDRWIRDPDFTQIHIVTLGEELPITETVELYEQIKKEFKLIPKVYLNKTLGLQKKDLDDLKSELKKDFQFVIDEENKARKILQKNNIKFIELPLVASTDAEKLIEGVHV